MIDTISTGINKSKKKPRAAFVIHRFASKIQQEVIGGAEFLAYQTAKHMAKYWDIEILTTCAKDYISWENEYPEGIEETETFCIRRFKVDCRRNLKLCNTLWEYIFNNAHTLEDEVKFLVAQGPYSSRLLSYIEKNKSNYDFFILFTATYCTTLFSMQLVPEKSFLVPTAENTPLIRLEVMRKLFNTPKGIIYLTEAEKRLIHRVHHNENVPNIITGIGIDFSNTINPDAFRKKFNLRRSSDNFAVYIGRVDSEKGCNLLFKYFEKYNNEEKNNLKLVVVGPEILKVPRLNNVLYLGVLSEEDKFNCLGAAKFLLQPSPYESLSIVLLEAWWAEKPAVVNGACEVTVEQCKKANAGLWFDSYEEFKGAINYLLSNEEVASKMGKSGKKYVTENYSWEKIEKKYLEFVTPYVI